MIKGDLVKVYKRNNWGGISEIIKPGILVKNTYCAYSKNDNLWDVYLGGKIVSIREKNLSTMKE